MTAFDPLDPLDPVFPGVLPLPVDAHARPPVPRAAPDAALEAAPHTAPNVALNVAPNVAENVTPNAASHVSSHATMPWDSAVRRILCVRLDNLGDVLMTTPAFHALRDAAPGRHLTLLASPAGAAAAPHLPDIDDVIAFDAPWMKNRAPATADATQALRETLAAGRYDAAVIFTVYSQSPLPAAMLCHLAGIPRRLAHCRENPYALLTDWVAETEPQGGVRHEVQRQLALAAHVGARTTDTAMRMSVRDADRVRIDAHLAAAGCDAGQPWIVVHPGASAPSRRYPPERFAGVAATLARDAGYQVLVTGAADEAALADEVVAQARAAAGRHGGTITSLAGALSLGELAALLERAAVLVSNNSGPVHIASALRTPVVDLYALTNPQHMPWGTRHRVLYRDVPCRWCYRSVCPQGHHECLLGVPAADVVAAALSLAGECRDGSRARPVADLPPLDCVPAG